MLNISYLKAVMLAYNFNQKDLSKKSGIPEANISRYLDGKRNMTINTAHKIAKALDMNAQMMVDIFFYEGKE